MQQLGGTGIIGQDMIVGFSNGKYTQFEGTEISIENCVKAKVKDLVVEGKTYQNLVSNLNDLVGNVYTTSKYASIPTKMFKTNTTYTVITTINESVYSSTKFGALLVIKYTTIGDSYIPISLVDGTFKIKFTTGAENPTNIRLQVHGANNTTSSFKLENLIIIEGDYTNTDLPNNINGIESVAEKERNLANYIIKAIGTAGERVVFDNKNCLKITSTFSRTIVLDDTSNYQIYVNAYANNENNKAYSIGDFGGTYISCGNKTWQGFKMTKYLNKFSIYNYQNSEVYIDLDTLSLVRVNNPYPLKLNVRGKNLFNLNNLESGNINTSTGKNLNTTNTMKRTIDYIKVNPKTQYIINSSCRVFEYDSIKKFLSSKAMAEKFTTSENTEYIKLHGNTTDEFVDDKKIQLEEGTVATSYESYREPSVTTLNLPIPLRSLPNGVADTIEGDKLVQRVGKVVLENIEDYNIVSQIRDNNRIGILVGNVLGSSTRKPIISDRFSDFSSGGGSVNGAFSYGKRIFLYLGLSTLDEYVEWFKSNPTTVYYELETPIIHDLEIPQLSTTKGTNVITTTNNIKPNLKMKVKVKK